MNDEAKRWKLVTLKFPKLANVPFLCEVCSARPPGAQTLVRSSTKEEVKAGMVPFRYRCMNHGSS